MKVGGEQDARRLARQHKPVQRFLRHLVKSAIVEDSALSNETFPVDQMEEKKPFP